MGPGLLAPGRTSDLVLFSSLIDERGNRHGLRIQSCSNLQLWGQKQNLPLVSKPPRSRVPRLLTVLVVTTSIPAVSGCEAQGGDPRELLFDPCI